MSLECGDCEADLRGLHLPGCHYDKRCKKCGQMMSEHILEDEEEEAECPPKKKPPDCVIKPVSSRICERGTHSCIIRHKPAAHQTPENTWEPPAKGETVNALTLAWWLAWCLWCKLIGKDPWMNAYKKPREVSREHSWVYEMNHADPPVKEKP